jgi:hypothetical protein
MEILSPAERKAAEKSVCDIIAGCAGQALIASILGGLTVDKGINAPESQIFLQIRLCIEAIKTLSDVCNRAALCHCLFDQNNRIDGLNY